MDNKIQIILASSSPRRKELLELITKKFKIIPSTEKEVLDEKLSIEEQIKELSYTKAKNVFEKTNGNRIVIGADTVVTKNGKIYGKPKNELQAKEMIKELLQGNKMHYIITGLSVLIQINDKYTEYKTYDKVKIYLKDILDDEIQKWIDTGKAMDKAGAYGIQDEFSVFIDKIEGNYTTAVGLPIHKLYDIIKKYE